MSARRRRRTGAHSAPQITIRTDANTPTRRSGWKILRHLLWTSTVASACTTTRVQTAPVPDQLRTGQAGEVRLSLRSGEVVAMFTPSVVGDSIIGFSRPVPSRSTSSPPSQRIAVARADVQSVAATELSLGKTIAASIVGGLATLTLLVAVCVGANT